MTAHREIPYNYTSADDRQLVTGLLGAAAWSKLEELRGKRVTGRSARLLMRFFGEVLIHRRNPYLYQELVDSVRRRRRFFGALQTSLNIIEEHAGGQKQLLEVLADCRALLGELRREVAGARDLRARMRRVLGAVVGAHNVVFDPFALVSHATDATDWRLHLPLAVVMPEDEHQVTPLLQAIAGLGLHAIPRGAGTGLTGGAVPLHPRCVMVNTEKLNRIGGIEQRELPQPGGGSLTAPVIRVEAGVITEAAMEYAAERGLVFATDPTSAWASSIGGNIAENAGGKSCVRWGTAIDNLLSWRMAMPGGVEVTVHRIGHPMRKILPDDVVTFEVRDPAGELLRRVELRGTELRKPGLWKDITNKALGGLPGAQKEGTDGVITSAEFVLYPSYAHTATLCLEFFGSDMEEAGRVINELAAAFGGQEERDEEALIALEHFDDQYVRAINYTVKAPRGETPKAVLVIDVVGHTEEQAARGVATIRGLLQAHRNTVLTLAQGAAEARRFWADRKRLGAIAARTNAFKLNEDIVLPLPSLAGFAGFVDELNVDEERHNQLTFVRRAQELLRAARPAEDAGWWSEKLPQVDALTSACQEALRDADASLLRAETLVMQLRADLGQLARGYAEVGEGLDALYTEVRARRLVIATHMHAGDGNVHVNIPVLSNDRIMMQRAELIVDRVMARVVELGGVVSGEHGIGITKLKYLEQERIAELDAYRRRIDPDGLMNPRKLSDLGVLDQVFTPSFNLLELEARILKHGSLEELAAKIAGCVRCGRCKESCCVFHPPRGLFYHPRNKNLAVGALVEALIYDTQRERSSQGFQLLRNLEEVADHCTICHKCAKPCPVNIDTGEVSVLERRILVERKFKHTSKATAMALRFLESRSRTLNHVFRGMVLRAGGAAQRLGVRALRPLRRWRPLQHATFMPMLSSPMPRPDPVSMRDVLPACDADQALLLEPERDALRTVFYFPGCGSERLYSRVGMATVYLLLKLKTRVVLPPPFLCCGFPAYANARTVQHGRTVLQDTILLSQIRDMFSYLTFDGCVVSCGTCRESLHGMEAGRIFGCELIDVAQYACDRGLRVEGATDVLYHAPCHDSLGGRGVELLGKLGGYRAQAVPHCCSEAGTLALSRPDISASMLHRKTSALTEALQGRQGVPLLTNCPSCLQGLGRNAALGAQPRHIAVELAERLGGATWEQELRRLAATAERIHF